MCSFYEVFIKGVWKAKYTFKQVFDSTSASYVILCVLIRIPIRTYPAYNPDILLEVILQASPIHVYRESRISPSCHLLIVKSFPTLFVLELLEQVS